jgi:hypothetical protein
MTARPCLSALLLACAAASLQAQGSPIQKGSLQLAGTAGWSHTHQTGTSNSITILQISPRVGYFVARGLVLSANLLYARTSTGQAHTSQYGVGPGLTYYVATRSRQLYPFVSGRTMFAWNRFGTSPSAPNTPNNSNSLSLLVSGGALVMVGQHVGVTGEVFFQHERFNYHLAGQQAGSNRQNTYGVQWGIAAFVF